MGLDQWLYRKNDDVCPICNNTERDPGGDYCFECIPHGEEVAYFRKVNFLHRWVEEHCNDGIDTNSEEIPIHLEAMAGLVQTCGQVLADPDLGPILLPTMGRFFFGSEAYDRYYIDDVCDVCDALVRILTYEKTRDEPGAGQYVYVSSW